MLGQSFTPAALSAVSGLEVESLEPRLATLVRRELLILEADPRSPERGQYAFVQALIREVAYNTLARKDRKTRHLAAARFFETVGTDELVGRPGQPLPGRPRQRRRGPRGRRPGRPGADRPAGRRGAGRRAGRARPGGPFLRAGRHGHPRTRPTRPSSSNGPAISATTPGATRRRRRVLRRALGLREAGADRRATAQGHRHAWPDAPGRTADGRRVRAPRAGASSNTPTSPATRPTSRSRASWPGRFQFRDENRRAVEVADRVLEVAEHLDLVEILAETLLTKGSALASLGRLREGIGIHPGRRGDRPRAGVRTPSCSGP